MNQNRPQILNRLDELHQPCSYLTKHPRQCESCSIYQEIRTLGEALLENPRRPEKIRLLLDKGSDMDSTDIQLLVELRVKKSVIRKAMSTS